MPTPSSQPGAPRITCSRALRRSCLRTKRSLNIPGYAAVVSHKELLANDVNLTSPVCGQRTARRAHTMCAPTSWVAYRSGRSLPRQILFATHGFAPIAANRSNGMQITNSFSGAIESKTDLKTWSLRTLESRLASVNWGSLRGMGGKQAPKFIVELPETKALMGLEQHFLTLRSCAPAVGLLDRFQVAGSSRAGGHISSTFEHSAGGLRSS